MEKKDQKPEKKKRPRIHKKQFVSVTFLTIDKINIKEKFIVSIGNIADELGVEVYAVGGYVRDYYLERPRTDFDFTIVGDAIKFAKKFAERYKSKAVIYEQFRTALVPIGNIKCEFVGTRKEAYQSESRKPIVKEGSLEDDLKRRDFTINAMAVPLNQKGFGNVIDIFNGKKDLDAKILRTPLEPSLTFSDDPLRMMRAARFASQLDFKIEESCLKAISKMSNRMKIISQERITGELLKILESPKPSIGFNILHETGLLKIIFPDIDKLAGIEIVEEGGKEYVHKDVFRHTLKVLDNVAEASDNLWLRFAALVHDIAKPKTKKYVEGTGWSFHGHEELGARRMEKIFRNLKLPLDKLNYVETLVRLHQRPMALVDDEVTDSAVRRLAFHTGEALEDLFTLCRADITTKNPNLSEQYYDNYNRVFQKVLDVQEKDQLREFQSPVRGDEIMKICGIEPSPAVGKIKSLIEEAILDGIIPNEYEPAKEYFLKNKDKWLEEIEVKE